MGQEEAERLAQRACAWAGQAHNEWFWLRISWVKDPAGYAGDACASASQAAASSFGNVTTPFKAKRERKRVLRKNNNYGGVRLLMIVHHRLRETGAAFEPALNLIENGHSEPTESCQA
jgi:hypothetical protein